MRSHSKLTSIVVSLSLVFCGLIAGAEEPSNQSAAAQAAATQADPARIDRDGKRICGFSLMNDSERGGYRNIMHQTKAVEDRDSIRVDHCARMRTRAQERGVPVDE